MDSKSIIFVDLNNFASFPTLAVGLLVASLRNAGHRVNLLVPLAYDVPAAAREKPDRFYHKWIRAAHLSSTPGLIAVRNAMRAAFYWYHQRPHPTVIREVGRALDQRPDILLLSAYLQHHATVVALCRLAKERGVPVLLGGPAFNLKGTTESWRAMPGLTAIYGGEADLVAPDLVQAIVAGRDMSRIPGITLSDGRGTPAAPPLRELDRSPVPDFTDFPWDRYPVRIVPIMTGRGCQWGRCLFCSDVVSANGRTFRTRSLESVLNEMREQSRRCATANFLFLDLKLNSNPHLLRGLVDNVQTAVPGAQWIGTVHVDCRSDNGLTRNEMRAAACAGMRRVSLGLESGSQQLLDLMNKGSSVEGNEAFIRHTSEAGISVRCTMFQGFPGETADDLAKTADFLVRNRRFIDRIRFNDFSILEDTPIWHQLMAQDGAYPGLAIEGVDKRHAKASYVYKPSRHPDYRRARRRVLEAVHAINRRPLRDEARMFDGLM
ncbi:radical SAM protein [Sphingomonas sp.]|uniref:B12-binding domain-containing radical SAM protein n=1 Tax=Sphingomonas sp. TaxID=28214 RepID=UPI0026078D88|nr:radical SAM protein [Sphingomonas sp.]